MADAILPAAAKFETKFEGTAIRRNSYLNWRREVVDEGDHVCKQLLSFTMRSATTINHLLLPAASFVVGPNNLRITQTHLMRSNRSRLHLSNDSFYGLTDDGDFAILGVNAYDSSDDDNNDSSIGQSVGDLSALLAGTTFAGLNESPTVNQTPTTSNNAVFGQIDTSSTKNMDGKRGNVIGEIGGQSQLQQQQHQQPYKRSSSADEAVLSEIKEWLLSIIPTLNQQDVDLYTRGLNEIGFHPACVTMSELQYEDLAFMKILHARYIFNEVTGIEHPWEV